MTEMRHEIDSNEYFILPTPEVETLLLDNQIDLVEALKQQGLKVEKTLQADPAHDSPDSARDLALVIVASGITAVALSRAIVNIINALSRRPTLVRQVSFGPALNQDGKVIKDSDGRIVNEWREQYRLIETTPPGVEREHINIGIAQGLRVELEEERRAQ